MHTGQVNHQGNLLNPWADLYLRPSPQCFQYSYGLKYSKQGSVSRVGPVSF